PRFLYNLAHKCWPWVYILQGEVQRTLHCAYNDLAKYYILTFIEIKLHLNLSTHNCLVFWYLFCIRLPEKIYLLMQTKDS
ncbi:hypothetical protein VIGAN_11224000, partial [Vigna angularis var. angularis]